MRFFIIALIFLIFDVELVLLFPFFLALASSITPLIFTVLSIFVVVLTAGLYYEWGNGMLEWNSFNRIFKKSLTVNEKMGPAPIKS